MNSSHEKLPETSVLKVKVVGNNETSEEQSRPPRFNERFYIH